MLLLVLVLPKGHNKQKEMMEAIPVPLSPLEH
jgi:hypothetical protein